MSVETIVEKNVEKLFTKTELLLIYTKKIKYKAQKTINKMKQLISELLFSDNW